MAAIRAYADTSVFGGVFDEEFAEKSRHFFREVQEGKYQLVVSALVQEEMKAAPVEAREFMRKLLGQAEIVEVSAAALRVRGEYLRAGIVGEAWAADALHVALATAARCALIVSWNFRHIVNFHRISQYNAVNRALGYAEIAIHSPQEVVEDENDG